GLQQAASQAGIAMTTQQIGGMFGLFFTDQQVETYAQATACNTDRFNRFFHAMLQRGVFFAPSAYEAGFISSAHSPDIIEATLEAARAAFQTIANEAAILSESEAPLKMP
ncbi:MAG TPA: aspartate aminotransferase family protein, partial [Xylella fastidiosa subsp. pauca]